MRRLVLLAAMLCAGGAWGQPPAVMWERAYGGTEMDEGHSVVQTSDGGFAIAGITESFASAVYDIYLVRTDSNGDTLWTQTYSASNANYCQSIRETSDGGFVLAGALQQADWDFYLIRIDSQGDTLWTRTYGGIGLDFCRSVIETSDGGFALCGQTDSYGSGLSDAYLVRTDSDGDTLWTRTYGTNNQDYALDIEQTSDGGFILAGHTAPISSVSDAYAIRTDPLGNQVWQHTFGGPYGDYFVSVGQTSDGGFIFAGSSVVNVTSDYDFYLVHSDQNGSQQWAAGYGGGSVDRCESMDLAANGGAILAGRTSSFGGNDCYIVSTDQGGQARWTKTVGGASADYAFSVIVTTDGGVVLAGSTSSFGAGNYDMYLVRLCSEPPPSIGTWALANSPYELCSDITIPAGQTLTIEAGVEVRFNGPYKMTVQGTLVCNGTQQDSITFTCDTLVYPSKWRGIDFLNTGNNNSRLDFCIIENSRADGPSADDRVGGGVFSNNTDITLRNCTIRNCSAANSGGALYAVYHLIRLEDCLFENNSCPNAGGGARLDQTSFQITGSTFRSNHSTNGVGGAVFVDSGDDPQSISNCTFSNNDAFTHGGAIYAYNMSGAVMNCTFDHDTAGGQAGAVALLSSSTSFTDCQFNSNRAASIGAFWCSSSSPMISRCVFDGNQATGTVGAFYCNAPTNVTLAECVFSRNSAGSDGGACYLDGGAPHFDHCTFSQNSSDALGGAIYIDTDCAATLRSSVFAFSRSQFGDPTAIHNPAMATALDYCNFYGFSGAYGHFSGGMQGWLNDWTTINANSDSCDSHFNLYMDPMFVDSANGDYHLQNCSSMIDAAQSPGTDIGAFPFVPIFNPPQEPCSTVVSFRERIVQPAVLPGSGFGYALAAIADQDSDGVKDILVGAPYYDGEFEDEGAVFIYSSRRLCGEPIDTLFGGTAFAWFGYSLESDVGDVNGDGVAEFAIGAPYWGGEPNYPGALKIFDGRTHSLLTAMTGSFQWGGFGHSIESVPDIDNDAIPDLLIGDESSLVHLFSTYSGECIRVLHAGGSQDCVNPVSPQSNYFGWSISYAGVICGEPCVLIGGAGSGIGSGFVELHSVANDNVVDRQYFASGFYYTPTFVLGMQEDVSGDGVSDAVVGVSVTSRAHVVSCGPLDTLRRYTVGNSDQSGLSLAYGRWGTDPARLIAIGAPSHSNDIGKVELYHASPAACSSPVATFTGHAVGDRFGHSILNPGDMNGDGIDDLVVGFPNEDQVSGIGGFSIFFSNETNSPIIPAAPEHLVIRRDTPTTDITLRWSPVTHDVNNVPIVVCGYEVQRSLNEDFSSITTIGSTADTMFTDVVSVPTQEKAYFRVRAVMQ